MPNPTPEAAMVERTDANADLALSKAVRLTAFTRDDPLAIRFEFANADDRLEAADEIDVILSDAFADARARMVAVLAEAREKRGGRLPKVRLAASPPPVTGGEGALVDLDAYDAGLLGDGGGGDVDWWQDYIRAELDRAHEFYSDQLSALATPATGGTFADGVEARKRYRHKARGTEYTVLGVGQAQGELTDEQSVMVYQGDDGKLWVRSCTEFHDGRFEPVPAIRALQPGAGREDGA